MPIYEFLCKTCGERFETLAPYTMGNESLLARCPNCLHEAVLERQVSVPNFQLRGGGWAKDGYSK